MSLNGKRVVVLGASVGIGLAVARAARREGAAVLIASSRKERLDRALKSLPETGVEGQVVDLSEEAQVRGLFLGQSQLVPGSQAALRVVVRDAHDARPLPGAEILVSLSPAEGGPAKNVFTGKTAADGTATVSFQVPEDGAESQVLKRSKPSPAWARIPSSAR